MSRYLKLKEEMLGIIEARRASYNTVLVKSAIVKYSDVWENCVTIILPLHESDSYILKEKIDYGDLVLFEKFISLKNTLGEKKIENLQDISMN